jgi:hypothetical protein
VDAGRSLAYLQTRRIDRHVDVIAMQAAHVRAVEAALAGQHAAETQEPVDLGQHSVLPLPRGDAVQHGQAHRAAEPPGGQCSSPGVGTVLRPNTNVLGKCIYRFISLLLGGCAIMAAVATSGQASSMPPVMVFDWCGHL